MDNCTAAELLTAATPVLLAVVSALATGLMAYGKGMRTPRREEHALRTENAVLREQVGATGTSVPPPPEPTP